MFLRLNVVFPDLLKLLCNLLEITYNLNNKLLLLEPSPVVVLTQLNSKRQVLSVM